MVAATDEDRVMCEEVKELAVELGKCAKTCESVRRIKKKKYPSLPYKTSQIILSKISRNNLR